MTKKKKERPIKFRATILVPIRQPLFDESAEKFNSALNELLSIRLEELKFSNYEASNFRIAPSKRRKPSKLQTVTIAGMTMPRVPCIHVAFAANLILRDFKGTTITGQEVPYQQRLSAHVHIACDKFANLISRLLITSHIARPGTLRCYEPEIYVDGRFLKTTGHEIIGHLGEVVEFASKESWPQIDTLPIMDVWRWITSITQDRLDTDVTRAFNAFTYLLVARHVNGSTLEDLMWAMVGLEALYGRGSSDLTYQLVEKSGALLGQKMGFDKAVKEMYRFRSSFVHGKALFPNAFNSDETDWTERHFKKADSASMLASAVLVASLQYLVKHEWKNLSFSHIVDNPPRET